MRAGRPAGRDPALDGIRGVAVCLVVAAHLVVTQHLDAPLRYVLSPVADGDVGVLIFFVLSGYLITSILQREAEKRGRISLTAFYARRVLRIWPAFFTYVAVIAVLGAAGVVAVSTRELAAASLFVWNYAPSVGTWTLGHTWSLAVEEQFYLLWPLLLVALRTRAAFRLSLAALAAEPVVRVVEYFAQPGSRAHIPLYLHTRADSLLTGAALALMPAAAPAAFARLSRLASTRVIQVAAVGVLFVVFPYGDAIAAGGFVLPIGWSLCNLATAVVILGATRQGSAVRHVLSARPLAAIGVISYSLYLWQQVFLDPFSSWLPAEAVLGPVGAFAAAWLSYTLVEKPFLRLKERWSRADTPAASEVPAAAVVPAA